MRHKRNNVTVELRKTLRNEQISKHRNIVLNDSEDSVEFNLDSKMTIDNIKEGTNNY